MLWGEKIFLLSADVNDGTRYVLCLSAADGRLLWKRDFASSTHAIHRQNSLASSTPTVDAERVYCTWATPEEFTLVALSHDGNEAWRANLGPFVSMHGYGGSPMLCEDLVVVTNDQDADSFLIAVDCQSGLTRWKVPRKVHPEQNTSYATPILYQPKDSPLELIVASWGHGITSVGATQRIHQLGGRRAGAATGRLADPGRWVDPGQLRRRWRQQWRGRNSARSAARPRGGADLQDRPRLGPLRAVAGSATTWFFCGAIGAWSRVSTRPAANRTGSGAWEATFPARRSAWPIAYFASRPPAKLSPWPLRVHSR